MTDRRSMTWPEAAVSRLIPGRQRSTRQQDVYRPDVVSGQILDFLWGVESATVQQIAAHLKVNPWMVRARLPELMRDGAVQQVGRVFTGKRGQPAHMWSLS